MKASLDLQSKKAHFARMRRSNYAASLRLEGFDTTPADGQRPLPTREAVLKQAGVRRRAKD
nr:YhfG family protein [Xenophilus azovorans]